MVQRSTPEYFSGNITGTNVVQDLIAAMESRIKQFKSNSVDAWEEFDVVNATAGARDVVFRSKGDRTLVSGAGDARLFFRSYQLDANDIWFFIYQDWTTDASGSGTNGVGGNNAVTKWIDISPTSELDYWGVANEYEFVFVFLQSGYMRYLWFGTPRRTHIPSNGAGIAFLASGSDAPVGDSPASITNVSGTATLVASETPFAGAGGDVGRHFRITNANNVDNNGDFVIITNPTTSTITYATTAGDGASEGSGSALELDVTHALDRDLSVSSPNPRMIAGQKTWLYQISDTAALKTPYNVICDVKAVGSSTITTLGTVEAYAAGSIVGLDPCPMGIRAEGVASSSSADVAWLYFTNLNDGSYVSSLGQLYVANNIVGYNASASVDPGNEGYYIGAETILENVNAVSGGLRGTMELVTLWARGEQADGDRMQNNLSTATADTWKAFKSFDNSLPFATFIIGIGPGAT